MGKINFNDIVEYIGFKRGLSLIFSISACAILISQSINLGIIHLSLIILLGWSGAALMNNVFDKKIDLITNPERTYILNRIGYKNTLHLSLLALLTSLILTLPTKNTVFILLVLSGIIMGIAYSVPPIRIRDTIFKPLGTTTIGLIITSMAASYYQTYTISALVLTLGMGLCTAIISIGRDLKDYTGDKKIDARTIPVIWGPVIAFKVIVFLYFIFYLISLSGGILFNLGSVYFLLTVLNIIASIYQILNNTQVMKQKARSNISQSIVYYGMFQAIILLISGTYYLVLK